MAAKGRDRDPVLVTGAGGFIGSHLVEGLVASGETVRAFVRYNSRNDWGMLEELPPGVMERVEVAAGDLRDYDAVHAAAQGVSAIFHLGALIAIPYSYRNPRDAVETNVLGTLNVLTAARRLDVPRVVHTSTSEVYGTAQYAPIDEKHPLVGQSPYSASKIGADKMAEAFQRAYGLPVATLRPFNTYGPRQSARAVIPTIITQALTSDTVRLGSLTPTRDLTFVADTVRGFLAIAACDDAIGKVVNIGTGREVAIGDLARRILELSGSKARIQEEKERLRPDGSEVERLVVDASLAKRLMGWSAAVGLEEGLGRTIVWMKANLDRYKPHLYNV